MWIGGLTKVVIYPICANMPQKVAVHATLIQGLRDIRQQTTWLSCKQLNWHQLRVPKITLCTCSWRNKEHFPLKMYSHSSRGTKVAATEGQWLLSKWLECTAAKNPDDNLKLMCTFPYILPTLYISITVVTSLNDVTIVCYPLLVGKPCACAQESCQLAYASAGIPTNQLLHTNQLIDSVSQFPSLWHSPPGILVCPHSRT